MYIKRHIKTVLERVRQSFPVVLITGARQVGKTTLLQHSADKLPYFTLDDYILLESVKTDSIGFIRNYNPPLIIDEIQYAPELLRAIKMRVDSEKINGVYFLTGSQQFELMKGVSESLVGRIGILTLTGLSTREINGESFDKPFIPTNDYFNERKETIREIPVKELWARIQRGSMPKLYAEKNINITDFYSAYVKTYIERDVRALTQVGDELTFLQFLIACAARTGELLNLSNIAKDIGISVPTAKRWLSILVTSNIVYLLQPFSFNITSRTVKTPKLYFLDTGLAAYLCKWLTPETLEHGAMNGAMFETYIVSEVIKSYLNAGIEPPLYFYRDSDQREIDLIIYQDGKIYPIEIKKTSSPTTTDMKTFAVLEKITSAEACPGALICAYDKLLSLSKNVIVPFWFV